MSARDYPIYWYSHVFSSHGVWMHRMAVGVMIFQLTGSPAWLGFGQSGWSPSLDYSVDAHNTKDR